LLASAQPGAFPAHSTCPAHAYITTGCRRPFGAPGGGELRPPPTPPGGPPTPPGGPRRRAARHLLATDLAPPGRTGHTSGVTQRCSLNAYVDTPLETKNGVLPVAGKWFQTFSIRERLIQYWGNQSRRDGYSIQSSTYPWRTSDPEAL